MNLATDLLILGHQKPFDTLKSVGRLSNLETLRVEWREHNHNICLCDLDVPKLSHLVLTGTAWTFFHCVGGAKRLTLTDARYGTVGDFREITSDMLRRVRGVVELDVQGLEISGPGELDLPEGLEKLSLSYTDWGTTGTCLEAAMACQTLKSLSFSLHDYYDPDGSQVSIFQVILNV